MKIYRKKKGRYRGFNGGIQSKQLSGNKEDQYEVEADAVADRVVQMAATEEPVMMSLPEEEEKIQMKPANEQGFMLTNPVVFPENIVAINNQSGKPLDQKDKESMETTIGVDFSGVRIHSDTDAANLSRYIGARAFTYKNHIFFNQGEFSPSSSEGRHLLAHELTHVVQQGAANMNPNGAGPSNPIIVPKNSAPIIQKQEGGLRGGGVLTSAPILNQAGSNAISLGGGFLLGWLFDAMRNSLNNIPVVPVERQDIQSFFDQISTGRRLRPMDILRTRLGRYVSEFRQHRSEVPFSIMERARQIDANPNVAQRVDMINGLLEEFQNYRYETYQNSWNIDEAMTLVPQLQRNIQSSGTFLRHLESGPAVTYMFYRVSMTLEEIMAIQGNVADYLRINRQALENLERLYTSYNTANSQNDNTLRMIRRARMRGRFSEARVAESDSPFDD